MNRQLQKFIEAFHNETVLRHALETLLTKIPNTSDVRSFHGKQEYGKDIIFYAHGGLMERRLYACVVKNTKITGSSDSSAGARTVFNQVDQALDTPCKGPKGQKERVEHVYVMSPHECTPETISSIYGKLQSRAGQVTFWCGSKLLGLFEEHWPDFLIFESGLLGSYVTSLLKKLGRDSALHNLLSKHGLSTELMDLQKRYVRPEFKQTLITFHIDIAQYDASLLKGPVDAAQIAHLTRSLESLADILSVVSYHKNANYTDDLNNKLRAVSTEIHSTWHKAADLQRQAGLKIEMTHDLTLTIEKLNTIGETLKGLIPETTSIIEEITQRVSAACAFAKRSFENPIDILKQPGFLTYCDVQSLSWHAPSVIRVIEPGCRVDFPEDLLSKHKGHLLVTGPAGFGKTSFCKVNTLWDIERLANEGGTIIPVYIPLHQFSQGDFSTLESFISPELKEFINHKRRSKKEHRSLRIYLDGLDEISSPSRQRAVIDSAKEIIRADPEMQVVATARDHVVGEWLNWLPRVRISELSAGQIRRLVSYWLDDDELKVNAFYQELAKTPQIQAVLGIPLLATLTLSIYRVRKSLPENRVRLYELFVELLAGGWDFAKELQRDARFGPAVKRSVIVLLAGRLHASGRRECLPEDFRASLKETASGLASRWDEMLEELRQDSLLVPVGGAHAFTHHSFQEFLAAKDMGGPVSKKANDILLRFLKGDDWWREVLAFYVAMCPAPRETESWVLTHAQELNKFRYDAAQIGLRTDFLCRQLEDTFPGFQSQRSKGLAI